MLAAMVSSSTRFTEYILIEIFTHLPLNSICKLKSLSKVWLSYLSSPYFFIKWFKINSKSLPWILYCSINDRRVTDKDADEHPLTFKMAYHDFRSEFMSQNEHLFSFKFLMNQKPFGAKLLMLGSSNGLVLCSVSLYPRKTNATYHVCNPLTQKWVSLPSPPGSQTKGISVSGIFCEYSTSFASCYQVVRIPEFDTPSKKFNVDMFSSDLGVWESFQVSCDENVVWEWSNFGKVVILNGVLFWVEGGHRLLVYNLNQKNKTDGHRCSLINLPGQEFDDADICNFSSRIGESEGWVFYAKPRWTRRGMTVSVWVLNEVNWKILRKDISVIEIFTEVHSRISEVALIQVLGFSPVDRNVVFLGCKNWVWGFNIKTRSFEELCLDNRHVYDAGVMFLLFVLKPMPTVLPPPSWIDTL